MIFVLDSLDDFIDDRNFRGDSQFRQFLKMLFLFRATLWGGADEQRGFLTNRHRMGCIHLLKVGLQIRDKRIERKLKIVKENRLENRTDPSLSIGRDEMRDMVEMRFAFAIDFERCHEIQSQQREIRQVFLAQRLIVQVNANQPQATQRVRPRTKFRQRLERRHTAGSDEYLFYGAATCDEESDRTAYLNGELACRAGELCCNEGIARYTSAIEAFQGRQLTRLQARDVTMY